MDDYITVRRKHLFQELVPWTPRPLTHKTTYIMKANLIKMPVSAVLKEKEYTPEKR